jgi:hypothetical protein
MTLYRQSYADRPEAKSSAFRARRTKTLAAGAVRTLKLALAGALHAASYTCHEERHGLSHFGMEKVPGPLLHRLTHHCDIGALFSSHRAMFAAASP